jgi:hypothetical protein
MAAANIIKGGASELITAPEIAVLKTTRAEVTPLPLFAFNES